MTKRADAAAGRHAVKLLAGGAAALLALGGATLAITARRSGISARAQAIVALLWASRRAGVFADREGVLDRIVRDRAAGPALPPRALRARFTIRDEQRFGARVFTITPHEKATGRRVLYLHGGAYIADLQAAHWTIVAGLAERTGTTVIVPIYPLAPEHDWENAFALVDRWWDVLVVDADDGRPVIAGDSAGGGLALAWAQQAAMEGRAMPSGLLLFSPWLDVTMRAAEQSALERRDPMLRRVGLREAGAMWAGNLATDNRRISPIGGSLDGLPPIAVFTGTHDILHTDARRLHDLANAAGIPIAYHRFAGMFHVWMGAPIPEGRRALDLAGDFIRTLFRRHDASLALAVRGHSNNRDGRSAGGSAAPRSDIYR